MNFNIFLDPPLIEECRKLSGSAKISAAYLRHTFSPESRYPLDEKTTDNLMDYVVDTKLFKFQWDLVDDPKWMLTWFTSEEEISSIPCWGLFDDCEEVLSSLKTIAAYSRFEINAPLRRSYFEREIELTAKWIEINNVNYNQIRIIYNPEKTKDIYFDPNIHQDYEADYIFEGGHDLQFGIKYVDQDGKEIVRIIIDNEEDKFTKRDELKKYLYGIGEVITPPSANDYDDIVNSVFKDIAVNQETDLTVSEDDFKTQGELGTNCFRASLTYTNTNPGQIPTNYIFSVITTVPSSTSATLKNNNEVVDKEILSKTTQGHNTTLIDRKEIVTFNKAALKAGIVELDNRLMQGTPTIIGISYGAKLKAYNNPGLTTDHYMVIVAKGRDAKGIYFRYFDPATTRGKLDGCRLYISEELVLSGEAQFPVIPEHKYFLTEILLDDNGLINNCIQKPTVLDVNH